MNNINNTKNNITLIYNALCKDYGVINLFVPNDDYYAIINNNVIKPEIHNNKFRFKFTSNLNKLKNNDEISLKLLNNNEDNDENYVNKKNNNSCILS
jgi:hypothetical protein